MVTSTTTLQDGSFVTLNCTKLGQEQARFEDLYLDELSIRCLKTDCAKRLFLQTVFNYVVSELYKCMACMIIQIRTIAYKEIPLESYALQTL